MSVRLSCVILNYNDAETTEKLVKQIADYNVLHQIIVVDNASTDDSLERLKKLEADQPGRLHVLSADHNGGYGSGNNLGVRYAAGQGGATHVLIANPDVVFSEQSLEAMLSVFARHPEVGIVTARIHDARFPDLKNGWPLRSFTRELLSMGPVSRRLFKRSFDYPDSYFAGHNAVYVGAVHGSCLLYTSHDWWIALTASCFGVIEFMPRVLSKYRQHGDNVLGAKDAGSFGEMKARLGRGKEVEQNYRRMLNQGIAFGRRFWKNMDTAQRMTLRAFLALPYQSAAGRLKNIRYNRFYKNSALQTLAMCLTMPRAEKLRQPKNEQAAECENCEVKTAGQEQKA